MIAPAFARTALGPRLECAASQLAAWPALQNVRYLARKPIEVEGSHCSPPRSNRGAVHEITTWLVRSYGHIAIEALQVPDMTRSAKGTVE